MLSVEGPIYVSFCVWADWCVELPCSAGAAVLVDESALTKAHDWPGNLFYEGRLNTYSTQMASKVTLGH